MTARQSEETMTSQPLVLPPQTAIQPTCAPVNPVATTIDETADWKVYKDEKYGYEIKYPKILKIGIISKRDNQSLTSMAQLHGGVILHIDYQDNILRSQTSQIAVYVYDSNNLSLETWIKTNSTERAFATEPTLEFHEFKKIKDNLVIDNLPAIEFQSTVMSSISHDVALKKGQYVYVVNNTSVGDDLSKIYDQMLSTFKFLE